MLEEPLYEPLPQALFSGADYANLPGPSQDQYQAPFSLDVDPGKKILILLGMGDFSEEERDLLMQLISTRQLVVIAENIANVRSRTFISNPELILAAAEEKTQVELKPDLLLTFGGQVVSKGLKLFLQSISELEVIQAEGDMVPLLKGLFPGGDPVPSIEQNLYYQRWNEVRNELVPLVRKRLDVMPFSNLAAVNSVLSFIPDHTSLHLGNSASIRYAQLIPAEKNLLCYSNRGTSGIDGCVSSAVGAAICSDHLHLLLVGDLSFVYDSNALWNKDYPANLRIVVLNDGGGGIFRLLEGPDRMDFFEEFSVTHHPVSLELLSQSFGRRFKRVSNLEELEDVLQYFFQPGHGTEVLEVDTTGSENSRIFKDFLNLK
jgi:2-succinyl-5-enolpyruvyl-6-hydroxy-3-cyclohexene-1-carboxylate synthase